MYTGLGLAPAVAIPAAIKVGNAIGSLFGKNTLKILQKQADVVAAKYLLAVNGDSNALKWLYDKSGGLPKKVGNTAVISPTAWSYKDFSGATLGIRMLYAAEMREVTYQYYVAASQTLGTVPAPAPLGMAGSTGTIPPPSPAVQAKLDNPKAAASNKISQASLFGLDLSSPSLLASLGFIALAFIVKERH